VKVPTYQAQTGLAADVGARPMRVRATPEAFGAAEARAMGALAEQVGDTALELNRRQREAAELEARYSAIFRTSNLQTNTWKR